MARHRARLKTGVAIAIVSLVNAVATAAESRANEAREFVDSAIKATAMHRIVATETMLSTGGSPSSFEEMGLTAVQLTIDEGDLSWRHDRWILKVRADAPSPLPGRVLVFKPEVRNGRVDWACAFRESSSTPERGDDSTTVPPELVPATCR